MSLKGIDDVHAFVGSTNGSAGMVKLREMVAAHCIQIQYKFARTLKALPNDPILNAIIGASKTKEGFYNYFEWDLKASAITKLEAQASKVAERVNFGSEADPEVCLQKSLDFLRQNYPEIRVDKKTVALLYESVESVKKANQAAMEPKKELTKRQKITSKFVLMAGQKAAEQAAADLADTSSQVMCLC